MNSKNSISGEKFSTRKLANGKLVASDLPYLCAVDHAQELHRRFKVMGIRTRVEAVGNKKELAVINNEV